MQEHQGNNIGSIAAFEITHQLDLIGFNPVTFIPGLSWTKVPFREQGGRIKEVIEETENGMLCTYTGSIILPCMRDDVDLVMDKYLGQKSVVRITDMNGRIYIIGAPGLPVEIGSTGDTGENFTNENAKQFEFKIAQPFKAMRA
ncbi:hypothetical protein [Pedobacter antarcticus]|uniref:hypothetical protein n=1 Tax=Pedobacter antarcticus TaxID=34086 RepID=UPI002930DF15|nr:hypothetical protein [Pedobacter antarcticus]